MAGVRRGWRRERRHPTEISEPPINLGGAPETRGSAAMAMVPTGGSFRSKVAAHKEHDEDNDHDEESAAHEAAALCAHVLTYQPRGDTPPVQ